MSEQSYKNHIRFYPPHHFIFLPAVFVLTVVSGICIFKYHDQWLIWTAITIVFFLLGYLAFMFRQHYSLMLQDRVVRLELRLRYYQLTGQRLEVIENRLTFGQLAALRFASDEELPELLLRALKENLSSNDIKKSIRNWQADDMRV